MMTDVFTAQSVATKPVLMRRFFVFLILATPFLFACAGRPYKPLNRFEKTELGRASIEVTPDMVRAHLEDYTNTIVAWAGVLKKTEAFEDGKDSQIRAISLLEHRYYDWVRDRSKSKATHEISTRGQGLFRVEWYSNRRILESSADDVEWFAEPEKVAVVYGIPEKVEPDGTVVLKYRYLRIFKEKEVDARTVDFGGATDPFRYTAH
jgi:hypothetical protein